MWHNCVFYWSHVDFVFSSSKKNNSYTLCLSGIECCSGTSTLKGGPPLFLNAAGLSQLRSTELAFTQISWKTLKKKKRDNINEFYKRSAVHTNIYWMKLCVSFTYFRVCMLAEHGAELAWASGTPGPALFLFWPLCCLFSKCELKQSCPSVL